jgi:hypothetical protein
MYLWVLRSLSPLHIHLERRYVKFFFGSSAIVLWSVVKSSELKLLTCVGWTSRELGSFVVRLNHGTGKHVVIYCTHITRGKVVCICFMYACTELCCVTLRCPFVGYGAFNCIHSRLRPMKSILLQVDLFLAYLAVTSNLNKIGGEKVVRIEISYFLSSILC